MSTASLNMEDIKSRDCGILSRREHSLSPIFSGFLSQFALLRKPESSPIKLLSGDPLTKGDYCLIEQPSFQIPK